MAKTIPPSKRYATAFAKKICERARGNQQDLEQKIDTALFKILAEMEGSLRSEWEKGSGGQPVQLDITQVIENLHWIVDFTEELYSRFGGAVTLFDIICDLLDILNKWKDALAKSWGTNTSRSQKELESRLRAPLFPFFKIDSNWAEENRAVWTKQYGKPWTDWYCTEWAKKVQRQNARNKKYEEEKRNEQNKT